MSNDYHEPNHRLSVHMHRKRLRTLSSLGYRVELPSTEAWFA